MHVDDVSDVAQTIDRGNHPMAFDTGLDGYEEEHGRADEDHILGRGVRCLDQVSQVETIRLHGNVRQSVEQGYDDHDNKQDHTGSEIIVGFLDRKHILFRAQADGVQVVANPQQPGAWKALADAQAQHVDGVRQLLRVDVKCDCGVWVAHDPANSCSKRDRIRSQPIKPITAFLHDHRGQGQCSQPASDLTQPGGRDGQAAVRRRRIALHQVEAG